jgi:hypothetical protein
MKWYYKLLLAFGLLVIAASFVATIGWPFFWKTIFKEAPPTDVSTFASLITIILTLLALGVAAFGVLVYYILRELLRRELRSDIEKRFNFALAHSEGTVVFGFWRMWRRQRDDVGLLDTAISLQRRALDRIADLKIEELPEHEKKAVYQAKSNLAGYIICKSRCVGVEVTPDDIARAKKEGKQAYDKSDEFGEYYDWKANYAAVLNTFGTDSQKQMAKQIIEELEERHQKGEITSNEIAEYRELWGDLS